MASSRRPVGHSMTTKQGFKNSTYNALTGGRILLKRSETSSKVWPIGRMRPEPSTWARTAQRSPSLPVPRGGSFRPFPPLPSCCRRTHTCFTGSGPAAEAPPPTRAHCSTRGSANPEREEERLTKSTFVYLLCYSATLLLCYSAMW
jgi:hypothetical protein